MNAPRFLIDQTVECKSSDANFNIGDKYVILSVFIQDGYNCYNILDKNNITQYIREDHMLRIFVDKIEKRKRIIKSILGS